MKSRLLLDVIVGKCTLILKLLTRENQALLIRGDSLLVLNLSLYRRDRVTRLNLESNRLARQGLHKDLHFISSRVFSLIDVKVIPDHWNDTICIPLRNGAEFGIHVITQTLELGECRLENAVTHE